MNSMQPWRLPGRLVTKSKSRVLGRGRSLSSMAPRSEQHAQKIAVVGGGITGLTAAYYAGKRYPSASITLFESSLRLGGCIESTYVPIGKDTAIVCERGPRTLRANAPRAPATYDLIDALGLRDTLISVPKHCPTAGRRYILYPDHLVSIPAFNPAPICRHIASIPAPSIPRAQQLLRVLYVLTTEPLFAGLLKHLLRSAFFSEGRPTGIQDESMGGFLARYFGHHLVDNIASAIMNGLCAGDVYRLSAKALLPGLWELEEKFEEEKKRGRGGLLRGDGLPLVVGYQQRENDLLAKLRRGPAGEIETSLKDTSVFSFKKGLQELPSALEAALARMENVHLHTGTSVERISSCDDGLALSISTQNGTTVQHFTHAIAATAYNHIISAADLGSSTMATATVMLVTLCFATPFLNHPHQGFGYLIPNSVPARQNPEHALGVVFDTDAMPEQQPFSLPNLGIHQRQHIHNTKITVVLGGHWWEGLNADTFPNETAGVWMARRLLQRHLGITEDPIASIVTLRKEAIPQYEVGHCERMVRLHKSLLGRFAGRLRVAGASYRGIGVHDCVFSAQSLVEGLELEELTGLECFAGN
ncbi:Protoporphyrinogen oxidase [Hypoxylon trugodes]|uniref:Protoporphyrinogen oxidase n=1 Tax=Hypoxylon trugodes TaxID=326681 RepID=UPI00219047A3|nr:Protoporphyrinogen oxidase [Hypoxylon trugodes]KAI1389852.1 Protoporphyrinogen oxidase [Hypoxylon trugodes]